MSMGDDRLQFFGLIHKLRHNVWWFGGKMYNQKEETTDPAF